MYSLEINYGSGFEDVKNFSFEGCSISRYRDGDSIRYRDKIDGSIRFYNTAYSSLKIQKDNLIVQLDAKLYQNKLLLLDFQLMLDGEWDYRAFTCSLSATQEDDYTKILKHIGDDRAFRSAPASEPGVTMTVGTVKRDMYQMRAVTIQGGTDNGIENELWSNCNTSSNSLIERFSTDKEYQRVDVIIPDTGTGGWDGYQSTIENLPISFCWEYNNNAVKSFYAAKKQSSGKRPPILPNASDSNWQFVGDVVAWGAVNEMGQLWSIVQFEDSYWDSESNEWQRGGCTTGFGIETSVVGQNLYRLLESYLHNIDDTITISFDTFFPYVYAEDAEMLNLMLYYNTPSDGNDIAYPDYSWTLQELIDVYKIVFDCDWRLEDKRFTFRHPSEQPILPLSYDQQPYQYFDRVLAKDWSISLFNSDEQKKIGLESFTVGNSLDKYFGTQIIDYNNTYTETIDAIDASIELDLGLLTGDATNNTSYCIVQYNDSKVIPSAISAVTGEWVYNINMRLNTLIKDWYTYDRPFWSGTLYSQTDNSLSTELDLIRYFILKANICLLYTSPSPRDQRGSRMPSSA